jgi:hypothetical protein
MQKTLNVLPFLKVTNMTQDPLNAFNRQQKAFKEEVKELAVAWHENDVNEVIDGVGDVYFVYLTLEVLAEQMGKRYMCGQSAHALGLIQAIGIELEMLNNITQEVIDSNMSKFDKTEEQAVISKNAYLNKGIEVDYNLNQDTGYYYIYATKDQTVGGKIIFKGKILKSTNFVEPNFAQFHERVAYLLGEN